MPEIYDNIRLQLASTLQATMQDSYKADFCVGYFNLRGWRYISPQMDAWTHPESVCRLLVGMQSVPKEDLEILTGLQPETTMTRPMAAQKRRELAAEFRQQLTLGIPNNTDEQSLRDLQKQLKNGKLQVKLFLRHNLHAKLYVLHRMDRLNPMNAYLGSSNLTFSGLKGQGELNVELQDKDTTQKLHQWFEDRWNDHYCLDITQELIDIIEESWASETLLAPYHLYVKMAYHLSEEARAGLAEFKIAKNFDAKLFPFQEAAVKIAAHHLHKRGGVLIGDVVGLGKTMMASALVRTLEDHYFATLILCPKNLEPMWQSYSDRFDFRAKIVPFSQVDNILPELKRYPLVLIDESHNLRNRETKTYKVIKDYIERNDSKVILLTATPYNKTYLDLSSQLRLFISENDNLGIRPESFLRQQYGGNESAFASEHQCSVRSIAAFEKSETIEDWQDLMRLYMVRRTRSFIQKHYAQYDSGRKRSYLEFGDKSRMYFPVRVPKTLAFEVNTQNPQDQFAQLFDDDVVNRIESLYLSRYGLANYLKPLPETDFSPQEKQMVKNMTRAGVRLKGFVRTNFFKRLESSGAAFLQSLERHILRNYVFLYALQQGLPIPIGSQEAALLDGHLGDEDTDSLAQLFSVLDDDAIPTEEHVNHYYDTLAHRAKTIYQLYENNYQKRFKWFASTHFSPQLAADLTADVAALSAILQRVGTWQPENDQKLKVLENLIQHVHPKDKVLVFSQFADTVHYVQQELSARGVQDMAAVSGASEKPTDLASRFSPGSNNFSPRLSSIHPELRVLITTDVLSEGQNLQDAHIVVNYDLPWAIIRLIQRAGRVDRLGQQSDTILAYSFLPAEGVEKLIALRERVLYRLKANSQVVGSDEQFFDDEDSSSQHLHDLYNEKSGILDEIDDGEIDLTSYAYQIWRNATAQDKTLEKTIPKMPLVVHASKHAQTTGGVLCYLRTGEGNDVLSWVNNAGEPVTESQFAILKAAECTASELPLPRASNHYTLLNNSIERVLHEEHTIGALGKPNRPRHVVYQRLNAMLEQQGELFEREDIRQLSQAIFTHPLQASANGILHRRLKEGIADAALVQLLTDFHNANQLLISHTGGEQQKPQIVCSMGLI